MERRAVQWWAMERSRERSRPHGRLRRFVVATCMVDAAEAARQQPRHNSHGGFSTHSSSSRGSSLHVGAGAMPVCATVACYLYLHRSNGCLCYCSMLLVPTPEQWLSAHRRPGRNSSQRNIADAIDACSGARRSIWTSSSPSLNLAPAMMITGQHTWSGFNSQSV